MKLTLEVQPAEGEAYRVTTNLFTIVALERRFKIKASDLATGIAIEHLAYLAYECCKQQNIPVSPVFDDFVKKIDAIDVVEAEAANPTNEGRTSED